MPPGQSMCVHHCVYIMVKLPTECPQNHSLWRREEEIKAVAPHTRKHGIFIVFLILSIWVFKHLESFEYTPVYIMSMLVFVRLWVRGTQGPL